MGVRCTSVITKKTQAKAKQRHRDYETTRCTSRSEKMEQRWQAATNEKEGIGWRRAVATSCTAGNAAVPLATALARRLDRFGGSGRSSSYGNASAGGHFCTVLLAYIFVRIYWSTLHVYCKYWPFHFIDSTGMILLSPWPLQRDSVFSCSTITPPPPFQLGHVT